MLRPTILTTMLLAAALGAACGDDPPTTPSEPEPVAVSETFSDILNPNGARTHPFVVERAGSVTAIINGLAPDAAVVVGLSLGTWNGIACQVILANDNAQAGQTLTGSATGTGGFCVRVYDTGRLTQNAEYSVTVTHF
jgi:hypothetical protein